MKTITKYIIEKFKISKDIKILDLGEQVLNSLGITSNYEYYNDILKIFEDYFNTYNINSIKDHKLNIYCNELFEKSNKKILLKNPYGDKLVSKIQFTSRLRTRIFRLKSQHSQFRVFDKNSIYIYRNEKTLIFITTDGFHIDLIFNYE